MAATVSRALVCDASASFGTFNKGSGAIHAIMFNAFAFSLDSSVSSCVSMQSVVTSHLMLLREATQICMSCMPFQTPPLTLTIFVDLRERKTQSSHQYRLSAGITGHLAMANLLRLGVIFIQCSRISRRCHGRSNLVEVNGRVLKFMPSLFLCSTECAEAWDGWRWRKQWASQARGPTPA